MQPPLRRAVLLLTALTSLASLAALGPTTTLAPAPAAAQQAGGHHAGATPAHSARVVVSHEPDDHDLVLRLGPIPLPASGHTMRLTPSHVVVVPVNGWLTRVRVRVIDEAGKELPDQILHHLNVVRPHRRELFMPIMQRLVAAGQETREVDLPFPFGVPVAEGDTLLVVAMVHNPTGRAVKAYVESTFHYDTPAWLDRVDVQPFFLDIQPPPATASFDLPPGRSTFTWEGRPAIDVKVLGLGGHMHEFGVELRLEEVRPDGEPEVLWRSRPETDTAGKVMAIPRKTFLLRLGLGLSAERTYRLVAVYDNPTSKVIAGGGMAEIGGIVLPRGDWPPPDPRHPEFREDVIQFTRFNPALGGHGAGEDEHQGH